MRELEEREGKVCFSVFRLRTEFPEASAVQLAEKVREQMNKDVTPQWIRV